jgi:hypothetical protein
LKIIASSPTSFTVKFNREDLAGVATGNAVDMTIKGTIYSSIREAQFEGVDTITVK